MATTQRNETLSPHTLADLVARLQSIEAEINQVAIERADPIRGLLLCSLSNNHLLTVGGAGVGKTMLMDRWAAHLTGDDHTPLTTFAVMVRKDTTTTETLGPDSLPGHMAGDPCRITKFMSPEAHFILADEIDKGGSGLLNSWLKIMNEREFQNGLTKMSCPLISFIAAANAFPSGDDLGAFLDRIAMKYIIQDLSDSGFHAMVWAGDLPAVQAQLTLSELRCLQGAVRNLPVPDGVKLLFEGLRRDLMNGARPVFASPRRWKWSVRLMQAHALLEGRESVEADDLAVLADCLWSNPEERAEIASRTNKLANPMVAKAVENGFTAANVYGTAIAAYNAAKAKGIEEDINDPDNEMSQAIAGLTKANRTMSRLADETSKIRDACAMTGRNTTRVEAILTKIRGDREQTIRIVMGSMAT